MVGLVWFGFVWLLGGLVVANANTNAANVNANATANVNAHAHDNASANATPFQPTQPNQSANQLIKPIQQPNLQTKQPSIHINKYELLTDN